MSDFTARLGLPFLQPQQAQKHVTLNDSLTRLDSLMQMRALSASLTAPPDAPAEGDLFLMPQGVLSGAWAEQTAGTAACFQDGIWQFYGPQPGWICTVLETQTVLSVSATGVWVPLVSSAAEPAQFGVNTTPDPVNRFAVKSDAELLSHDDVTPGTGNARKVINKASAGKTASILFQSNWAGRAEIGLLGDEQFGVSVSANGTTFTPALQIDRTTARAAFPAGLAHAQTGAAISSLLPTTGGDGVVSIYRIDAARAQNPRTFGLQSISGDLLGVPVGTAATIFAQAFMGGVSLLRIWNTSLSPAQPAWIKAQPDANTLRVLDAAALADWQIGHTLQVGDPDSVTPGRVITLDISPMMQALFGTVFAQTGVVLRMAALAGPSCETALEVSPSGAPGTFLGTRGYAGAHSPTGQFTLFTAQASPVSASRLVCVRESALTGQMGVSLVSVNALLV